VPQWHEQIGDATIADGILDRLVHNAHRIELRGESMRKSRNKKSEADSPPRPDSSIALMQRQGSNAAPASALHPRFTPTT